MNKTICFSTIVSFLIVLVINVSAMNFESPTLSGTVVDMKVIDESAESVSYRLSLDMCITNKSDTDVILYKSDFDPINITLFTLGKNAVPNYLFSAGGRRSYYQDSETKRLKKGLDVVTPPLDSTITLKPGESFSFRTTANPVFLKKRIKGSLNETWKKLVSMSPIFMTVELEMFPTNFSDSKSSFGEILQKRWHRFGVFWFKDMSSQPITLDLRSTQIKPRFLFAVGKWDGNKKAAQK